MPLAPRDEHPHGRLVDELEELGYVRREPDPRDRRAKLVVPTELGLDEMWRADAIEAESSQSLPSRRASAGTTLYAPCLRG